MTIPNLKRIKVSSALELQTLLAKKPDHEQSLMLVTYSESSHANYVSREQVNDIVAKHAWQVGTRYTLNGNLLGHVISKKVEKRRA